MDQAEAPPPHRVRLDKWLWAARFYKTRALAAEAIDGGKVEVNGDRARRSRLLALADTVRARKPPFGQVVVLQVEDSGPGIPPAERDLVFQPFYRALGTNVDGSGLGLAIVSEIARRHGAELTLEDARGSGAGAPAGAHEGGPGARFTLRFAALIRHEDSPPTSAGDTNEVHP